MALFTFDAGTLSSYDKLKFTNIKNCTRTTTPYFRVLYIYSGGQKEQAFYNTDDKDITLSGQLTSDQLATVTTIAVGGSGDNGSVVFNPSNIKLVNSSTGDELVCTGVTTRTGNPNGSYRANDFTWTSASSNTMQIFSFAAGTLSKYGKLYLTTSDFDALGATVAANDEKYRVLFINGEGTPLKTQKYSSIGAKTIDLLSFLTDEERAATVEIAFGGVCAKGTIHIEPSSIYLEAAEESEEITLSSPVSGFEWYKYSDGTVYGHSQSELHKRLGQGLGSNQVIYGPTSENGKTAYMDVTDYDEMIFTTANDGTAGLRLLYGDATISTTETNAAQDYSVSLATIDKIGNIKTRNASVTAVNVSAINFKKSFLSGLSATPWSFAKDVENTTVSLNRNFTADQSSTIWLPFDLTAEQAAAAGEFYEFVAFDGSNLGFNPVTEPQAYTPYLFIPASSGELFNNITTTVKAVNSSTLSATGGTATFKGVLQHIDNVKGAESGTVYGYDATNGDFVQVTGDGVSIDAFRAYIVISGGAALAPRLRVTIHNAPTAVENVQSENIQGTKVLRDGQLYIKYNGTMYNVQGQKVNR